MLITLVYEPPRLPPTPMRSGPERFAGFLDELSRYAGAVRVIEGRLSEVAPAAGFVLLAGGVHPAMALDECSPEQRLDLATRLVPLGTSQKGIFALLEEWLLPAAVENLALVEWEAAEQDEIGARGLYGRRDVGQRAGASCVELFSSAHYCYLQSVKHHGLPHLLVDYLSAWPVSVGSGEEAGGRPPP